MTKIVVDIGIGIDVVHCRDLLDIGLGIFEFCCIFAVFGAYDPFLLTVSLFQTAISLDISSRAGTSEKTGGEEAQI